MNTACISVLALLFAGRALAADAPLNESQTVSEAVKRVMGTARGNGEVMRLWMAWKTGNKDAPSRILALAKSGDHMAQNLAGYMLDNGEGFISDPKAAAEYFQAAATEIPLARYNLGVLYFNGRGVAKNDSQALELFRKSIQIPQSSAILALTAYKKGDSAEAWKWANEAATRANPLGFYLLGRMLYEKQDYKEAFGWLTKASQNNEPNAPAILSKMYEQGQGVPQDKKIAAGWWMVHNAYARTAGGLPALSNYGLSGQERSAALKFANDWLATHPIGANKIEYSKTLAEPPRYQ